MPDSTEAELEQLAGEMQAARERVENRLSEMVLVADPLPDATIHVELDQVEALAVLTALTILRVRYGHDTRFHMQADPPTGGETADHTHCFGDEATINHRPRCCVCETPDPHRDRAGSDTPGASPTGH